ncbi:acVLRF1 family peptidyl-tRNA hydrolase [Nakamurella sp.]|uniref:acVLRF1 family peptidyl-tRNA hydrolase n=1 Tax=Nakamurella sp. TaxID=1869182 RepID=UPI00378359A7
MTRRRTAAGGGTAVEVPPERLVGWINRFGTRNGGLAELSTDGSTVRIRGGDGTLATIEVPFGPMDIAGGRSPAPGESESGPGGERDQPVEALLDHLASLGPLGLILVRGGAHSVGVAVHGAVVRSSTDRAYLQGRTAAGGWSQQRFARRRGNQRAASLADAAETAARVLLPEQLAGLVSGGDRVALAEVLADPRLAPLAALPTRTFADVPEPRRAVLDDVATRSLSVPIIIEPADP